MSIDSAGSLATPRDGGNGEMRHYVRALIDGAIAGAFATWVMGKATDYLHEHESKQVRRREDDARGGKTAYGAAAEKVADIAGVSLSDDERKKAGTRIHWALGITAGAAYGAIKRDEASISPLRGWASGLSSGP